MGDMTEERRRSEGRDRKGKRVRRRKERGKKGRDWPLFLSFQSQIS